jgi:FAD/FMN-containing dehydrogenase
VSAIISAGILPAALEMMDNLIIRAVEASVFTAGLPTDAQAVLLVELDGMEAGIDEDAAHAEQILKEHGARSVRLATDVNERKKLWAARKGAFGAVGRLSPDIMIQDAVVPRSRLPEVLAETYRISARYNLQLANVFHAGDGNLHPLICFDLRRGDDLERVRQAGREIMEVCVAAGGSITGEHGVGLDKSSYLPLIFSEDDMAAMLQVRAAFDPSGLCNPGKIIPLPRGCGEARAVATQELSESRPVGVATGHSDSLEQVRAESTNLSLSYGPREQTTHKQTLISTKLNEARIVREFSLIVGDQSVRRLPHPVGPIRIAESNSARLPLEVAPQSSEAAAQVMRLAAKEELATVPAGAATWIDAGNPLESADLIVSTRRMNRLVRHEPKDLVATAEAGLTLRAFQEQLAQAGQWLPIDPPDDGRVTLGGVVATGLGGPHSFGFGAPRSFVIGMKVVLADGRSIKAGGNVVKNVAGYDLCKLFTGSFGTLGLITELTFKLRPLPAETRTVVAKGTLASLISAGRKAFAQLSPVALELISPDLAQDLQIASRPDYALMIRFVGSPRSVVAETARALKLLRDEGTRCETLAEDPEAWSKLSAAPLHSAGELKWRVALRPTDLVAFLIDIAEIEGDEASHPGLRWHTGLGDGRLRAIGQAPVYHREAVRSLERLRQRVETLGGSLVLESAPSEIKDELDAWGDFGSRAELMKRVKAQLDPQNLLSPGRFVSS